MGYAQLAAAIIALLVKWADYLIDRNKARKAQKQAILKEIHDAIKVKDESAITACFDRLNRI